VKHATAGVKLTLRHDFYQTDTDVIVSLYIKGYAELKDKVDIAFEAVKVGWCHMAFADVQVSISLPNLTEEGQTRQFALEPLHAAINPDKSSARVLSSKVGLCLNTTPRREKPALTWPRSSSS